MKKTIPFLVVCIIIFFTSCSGGFEGKRVLITAPDGYAQRFVKSIENAGGIPISVPMIETVIPGDNPAMDSLVRHPGNYDWVAFPSRKAIEAFFLFANKLQAGKETISGIHACAIGKDADLLVEYGIKPAIVPTEPSPAGIVSALREKPGTAGQTIVVLAPKVEKLTEPDVVPNFIKGLEAIPMKVIRVDAYTTRPAEIPDKEQFVRSVTNGKFDVIAFSSTAEIEAFIQVMDGEPLPKNRMIACFGPYTAGNARKLGLKVDIVSKDFSSFDGFAASIREFFEQGKLNP